jgi:hypothetical protein
MKLLSKNYNMNWMSLYKYKIVKVLSEMDTVKDETALHHIW